MRQIVLDAETTGLEPSQGHRVIEIGCVELKDRRKTDAIFHQYMNPERKIEDGAYEVHGLSNDFLSSKPLFKDIVQDFINYVKGSELIIHNATFDVAFINAELSRLGHKWGKLEDVCQIVDTLKLARELHPGQKNNLDALCTRYYVDNSHRDVHGALLDAQILLDVYLAMTGGQAALSLGDDVATILNSENSPARLSTNRPALRVIRATEKELKEHQNRLNDIDSQSETGCLWKRLDGDSA